MSIIQNLKDDLTTALKSKDEAAVLTYRGLLSAIHNKEIELKHEPSDEEVLGVLSSQAKQREDSISEFKKGGRDDLAKKEQAELELIKKYLPAKMSEEEVAKIVDEAIKTTKASSMQDIGRVMAEVMKQGKGQIDGATASKIVKLKLGK